MNELVTTLDFRGDALIAIQADDAKTVAMKPIVEALGLTWGSQYNRLKRDPVLAKGIFVLNIPSAGGMQEATCIDYRLVPLWAAKISVNHVKPELRDKLIAYQTEVADVLARHFLGVGLKDEESDDEPMNWKRLGGVVKSVVNKALDARLAQIDERITDLAIAADPRVAALNLISVRQLLDEAKCLQKKRNGINRRVGNALRDLALKESVRGCRRCPHSDRWLFPIDFARKFMALQGQAWVDAHNAAVQGQGVLTFPRRGRPRLDPPAEQQPDGGVA